MPTLKEMWLAGQFVGKQSKQIIPLAGDSNIHSEETSSEIRDWLTQVAVEDLQRFARECLEGGKSQYSGYFLQDIINELGRRLGFNVTFGRYQGSASNPAPDGVWRSDDWSFIVEVKTTDSFRIPLDRIAHYRAVTLGLEDVYSSALIVVGREDTGDLEAQIRGSKHAWDMRLIGIDALFKLALFHRDSVEQENVLAKIRAILRPVEYTRVDNLLNVVFETARAASSADENELVETIETPQQNKILNNNDAQPVIAAARREQFRLDIISAVSTRYGKTLTKFRRSLYESPDQSLRASLAISKNYGTRDEATFLVCVPHAATGIPAKCRAGSRTFRLRGYQQRRYVARGFPLTCVEGPERYYGPGSAAVLACNP
jgi:hypothetical protein